MSDDATTPDISIVRGDPTPAEIAAVTAVVTAALEQAADEAQDVRVRSAWSWSQRTLRTPIVARPGAWSSFPG